MAAGAPPFPIEETTIAVLHASYLSGGATREMWTPMRPALWNVWMAPGDRAVLKRQWESARVDRLGRAARRPCTVNPGQMTVPQPLRAWGCLHIGCTPPSPGLRQPRRGIGPSVLRHNPAAVLLSADVADCIRGLKE
jgi:hypothetical protein